MRYKNFHAEFLPCKRKLAIQQSCKKNKNLQIQTFNRDEVEFIDKCSTTYIKEWDKELEEAFCLAK